MIRTTTCVAKAGIRDQDEAETLISCLKLKGYLPVIRSMLSGMFELAKLPEPEKELTTKILKPNVRLYAEPKTILGDIFLTEDSIFSLTPQSDEEILQASAAGYGEVKESLKKFCGDIEEGIRTRFDGRRVRAMEFDWKTREFRTSSSFRQRSISYRTLPEDEVEPGESVFKCAEPKYSHEDVQAARLIVDMEIRAFILKLAQVTKIREKDADEIVKKQILERVFSAGLVTEEYLLTCKQDQHTICVVSSKDNLTQDPLSTLRCSVCGRSFPQENLQVIYTLTERAKKLVNHSLWMSIWTTELLKENGVRAESIKWGLEASGEELDLMVEDFGARLFFELKDREFGLGDAYPFVYRTTRYGGRFGIVVTMDKVSTDAQKFFEEETKRREYPINIRCLEGPESISKGIKMLTENISILQARRLITPFSRGIGFDLWPIVERWIDTKIKETSKNTVAVTANTSG